MYRATTFQLALPCLLLLLSGLSSCDRRQHLVEQHLVEFGTIIEITMITGDLPRAEQLLTEIERRLRHYRKLWHAWEDSDLTRFNAELQRSGQARMPDGLAELLRLSSEYHDASGGLFNPALGKLIAAYGFHDGEVDTATITEIRQDIPTMRDLVFDGNRVTSNNPHLQIDLGGIAKGHAIGLIADYLDANDIKHYIVNAGGDMKIAGNRFGRPWRLGIQNPFAPGVVASLKLEGSHSLFTSGNYHRQYWRGGKRTHHIIDPRSGESSIGQSSVTVLLRDPVRADVAATVLMIDGLRKTADLALSLGVDDFLIVSESQEILVSQSFFEKLEIELPWPVTIVK